MLVALPFTLKTESSLAMGKIRGSRGTIPLRYRQRFQPLRLGGSQLGARYRDLLRAFLPSLGIACIALICILAGVFHVLSRDKRTLVPVAAFLVWGILPARPQYARALSIPGGLVVGLGLLALPGPPNALWSGDRLSGDPSQRRFDPPLPGGRFPRGSLRPSVVSILLALYTVPWR